MRRRLAVVLFVLTAACPAVGLVFISEVHINPAGSFDTTEEFIELQGTPGMKLDGYAVVLLNGTRTKYWPSGAPYPADQEIDEFFSLDGLSLGANGLLVLGYAGLPEYPTVVPHTSFRKWTNPGGIWNGYLDTPGKLQNDGSNAILLIRNRPGAKTGGGPCTPCPPAGLRWGKDIDHDREHTVGVTDPNDPNPGNTYDQWGDGDIDEGNPGTVDMKGRTTPADISDDLEVVDEVSYEHDRGWEYDVDGRHVDLGSTSLKFPYRHVHALDDPQGLNPDALTRVDYRTKGPGWTPVAGAVGEMANGNNWQDTATEQWIRGETVTFDLGDTFFFSNAANANPDAIQPFMTHVPLWLNDGTAPDYNFADSTFYQVKPGQVNPLSIAFIPGDVDRDGDVDADDIAKVASVFGNNDWIFSNSWSTSPETDHGDPAAQIRPWDVDGTGDNGIEASDLQWVLNFLGQTQTSPAAGRIRGVGYETDSAGNVITNAGIYLNPPGSTACTVTFSPLVPSSRPLDGLHVGDTVLLTVRGQVTAGANAAPAQENGIMQFVHDLTISNAGVVKVTAVEALNVFQTTRAAIQTLQGDDGDLGVQRINGYTTSFVEGLTSPAAMYRVTLEAIGEGSATVAAGPATETKFALSTPQGLKVGHTANHGNPASAAYPTLAITVISAPLADLDDDGDVDGSDFGIFAGCFNGTGNPVGEACLDADFTGDAYVDGVDFGIFSACFNGSGNPPNC